MKRIVIIILIIFSISLASCNKNNNNEQYEFITKDTIVEGLNTFYIEVELLSTKGETNAFTMVENDSLIYYEFKSSKYLINKATNEIYVIDNELQVKLLDQKSEFDYEKNKQVLIDLLGDHIDNVDLNYKKSETTTMIGSFVCYAYESLKTVNSENYVKDIYYVDEETGYCIKNYSETSSFGVLTVAAWEVKDFSLDSSFIANFFIKFDNYEIGVAPMEFDQWPTMGLGLLIPEFTNGTFMFCIDNGDNAMISINDVSYNQVKNYTSSLVNYGFEEGIGSTNEAGQYIFITYNSDFVMVRVSFSPSNYSVAIRIIRSTQEEINKEMSKL